MEKQLVPLIDLWIDKLNRLKRELYKKGSEANSYEYQLLSVEAICLSSCINDVLNHLRVSKENVMDSELK